MAEGRKEKVYVLYGSQTGNSEQAAKDFCSLVSTKLSPAMIQTLTGCSKEKIPQVEATHMQLDDFLELERCKWTRLTIIFTSSYGVGQAPLGCYRFRDLCDAWHDQYHTSNNKDNNNHKAAAAEETTNKPKILDGLYFAMCGLGDSKYTTYFQNPTRIHEALQLVGAKRVGPLGQADASGTGDLLQSVVIERWMDCIWTHLATVLVQDPPSTDRLAEMEKVTVQLCEKINPDFEKLEEKKTTSSTKVVAEVLIVLVAIFAYYYYHSQVGMSK